MRQVLAIVKIAAVCFFTSSRIMADHELATRSLSEQNNRGWWREWEPAVLALLVFLAYFTRLAAAPICGEESRWATAAREMIATGDWIVPRQQGTIFPERPPLTIWAMALAGFARHGVDLVAVRAPVPRGPRADFTDLCLCAHLDVAVGKLQFGSDICHFRTSARPGAFRRVGGRVYAVHCRVLVRMALRLPSSLAARDLLDGRLLPGGSGRLLKACSRRSILSQLASHTWPGNVIRAGCFAAAT